MSRGLITERADHARHTVRGLVASGFKGNVAAAGRAWGIGKATLGAFLRGQRGLGATCMVRISEHTGLSLDALVGIDARAASNAVPTPSRPEAESEIRRSSDAAESLTGGRGTPLSDGRDGLTSAMGSMRPGKYDTSEHTLVELVKDRALMLDDGRAALIALAIELSDGRALPHDCDTLLEWARFELVEHLPEVMLDGGFVEKHGPMGALGRVRDMIATLDSALRAVRQIEGLLIDDIEHSRRENAANENGGAK